jgi:ribosomal protein S27AE
VRELTKWCFVCGTENDDDAERCVRCGKTQFMNEDPDRPAPEDDLDQDIDEDDEGTGAPTARKPGRAKRLTLAGSRWSGVGEMIFLDQLKCPRCGKTGLFAAGKKVFCRNSKCGYVVSKHVLRLTYGYKFVKKGGEWLIWVPVSQFARGLQGKESNVEGGYTKRGHGWLWNAGARVTSWPFRKLGLAGKKKVGQVVARHDKRVAEGKTYPRRATRYLWKGRQRETGKAGGIKGALRGGVRGAREVARYPRRRRGRVRLRTPKESQAAAWINKILPSLIMIVVGFIVSAMLNSITFVFAFISLAFYTIMPDPPDVMQKIINKTTAKYDKRREKLNKELEQLSKGTKMESEEMKKIKIQLDSIDGEMRAELEARAGSIGTTMRLGLHEGRIFAKDTFKFTAFVCFSLAFLFSPFPLAKPFGLLLSFLFYFLI